MHGDRLNNTLSVNNRECIIQSSMVKDSFICHHASLKTRKIKNANVLFLLLKLVLRYLWTLGAPFIILSSFSDKQEAHGPQCAHMNAIVGETLKC